MVGIPSMVSQGAERFLAMTGIIAVEIRGQGAWTIHFGRLDEPVSEGTDPKADLFLVFSEGAFSDFLAGRLNGGKAMAAGELTFSGDPSHLEKLGYLLSTGGSPLATRLGAIG